MKRLLVLLIACMALVVVVAGCGDDDDDSGNGGGGGGNTEQPADTGGGGGSGGGGGGGGAEVGMMNIQFDPQDVTIKAGETVTWTNDEGVAHDVDKTSGPGPQFSSGPEGGMMEGDTFEHTFDRPGTYEYICRVHAPGMAGTIEVTE
jgi:plastocyanin